MSTLILSSRSVVYDRALGEAAARHGWRVIFCEHDAIPASCLEPVIYVSTDLALSAAHQLNIALIEPNFDLLARIPERFRRRAVEFARFADLTHLRRPTFVKPADPLDKWFDAGVYSDIRDIRTKGLDRPSAPVLVSDPVEWSAEFRCFVLEGRVIAASPYLSFGRPTWKPHSPDRPAKIPQAGQSFVAELCLSLRERLPPAFVVDIGMIEGLGWAIVEFNPIFCAGLLGADPAAVLPALKRASLPLSLVSGQDSRWLPRIGFGANLTVDPATHLSR